MKLVIKSLKNWNSEAKILDFINILKSENSIFRPNKFGDTEPTTQNFNENQLHKFIDMWQADAKFIILKELKPFNSWMMIKMWPKEANDFNELIFSIDQNYFTKNKSLGNFINFSIQIYNWAGVTHGYMCHEKEFEMKNYFGVPTNVIDNKIASTGGTRLQDGLPGVYWGNFFGKEYVNFFGKEKVEKVENVKKMEMIDGGMLIVAYEKPGNYFNSNCTSKTNSIIDNLGRNFFFEKINPTKKCLVPYFNFEQDSWGHEISVAIIDPIDEIIPNPQEFIDNINSNILEFINSYPNEVLNFSPESLQKVDSLILKKSKTIKKPLLNKNLKPLLRQLTAYYGEVLCKNLKGKWEIKKGNTGLQHPAVSFISNGNKQFEFPFTRVLKLWNERNRTDGLYIRFCII